MRRNEKEKCNYLSREKVREREREKTKWICIHSLSCCGFFLFVMSDLSTRFSREYTCLPTMSSIESTVSVLREESIEMGFN